MKTAYHLLNEIDSENFDEIADAIFELLKEDRTWSQEVLLQYIANLAAEVHDLKQAFKHAENAKNPKE